MKKVLHALSGALLFLTPLVWGSLLVYGNGYDTDFRDFLFKQVTFNPIYGVVLGLVLLVLILIYLGTFGRSRKNNRFVSFESDSGSVSVSVNAVRDFVRKIGDEFGAVVSLDPRVYPDRNMISIDLNVKIQTGTKLPELSGLLQGRVRECIRDGLGITDVREITVKVQEIVGVPPSPPTPAG